MVPGSADCSGRSVRAATTTSAPSCASRSAICLPIPRLAPITIAPLPARRIGFSVSTGSAAKAHLVAGIEEAGGGPTLAGRGQEMRSEAKLFDPPSLRGPHELVFIDSHQPRGDLSLRGDQRDYAVPFARGVVAVDFDKRGAHAVDRERQALDALVVLADCLAPLAASDALQPRVFGKQRRHRLEVDLPVAIDVDARDAVTTEAVAGLEPLDLFDVEQLLDFLFRRPVAGHGSPPDAAIESMAARSGNLGQQRRRVRRHPPGHHRVALLRYVPGIDEIGLGGVPVENSA